MEPDLEGPQINAFELDGRRGYRQRFIGAVTRPTVKLIGECYKVAVDLSSRGNAVDCCRDRKLLIDFGELGTDSRQLIAEVTLEVLCCEIPTSVPGTPDHAAQVDTGLPGSTWQFHARGSSRITDHRSADRDGGSR
jgi:hypothetical protein